MYKKGKTKIFWPIIGILVFIAVILYIVIGLPSISQPNGFVSAFCTPYAGFHCNSPVVTTSGLLSVTISQNLNFTQYNVSASCVARGLPSVSEFRDIKSIGQVSNTLRNGEIINVTGLQCYNANGTVFSGPTGTSFTGQIFLNYSVIGTRVIEKVATFSIKTT